MFIYHLLNHHILSETEDFIFKSIKRKDKYGELEIRAWKDGHLHGLPRDQFLRLPPGGLVRGQDRGHAQEGQVQGVHPEQEGVAGLCGHDEKSSRQKIQS